MPDLFQKIMLCFASLIYSNLCIASPVILFDGSGIPEDQGWTVRTSGSPTVTTQTGGGISDVLHVETTDQDIYLASKDALANSFLFSTRVAVDNATHNSFDAGFMLGIFGVISSSGTIFPDRSNGIYIDNNEIGFMDDLGPTLSIDATVFHEYAILFDNTTRQMDVFVDVTFADILSSVAAPALSRTVTLNPTFDPPGMLFFGDQTNDSISGPNVNSSFTLDFVKLETFDSRDPITGPPPPDPNPVPLPASIFLMSSGLVWLFGMGVIRSKNSTDVS